MKALGKKPWFFDLFTEILSHSTLRPASHKDGIFFLHFAVIAYFIKYKDKTLRKTVL